MYLRKTSIINYSINILSLVIFIFSVGSNTLVSNSRIYNKSKPYSKSIAEVAPANKSSFTMGNCCCDISMSNSDKCCCKSPTLGIDSRQLAANQSERKLFNVFISSVKCSKIPDSFQIVSLSDYEYLYPDNSICLFERTGFLSDINDNRISDPHLSPLYRPPREITDNLFHKLLT